MGPVSGGAKLRKDRAKRLIARLLWVPKSSPVQLNCAMRNLPILLACLLIGVIGCSRGEKIVGQWAGDTQIMGQPAHMTLTVNANGTYTNVAKLTGAQGTLIATDSGKWKLAGNKMTSTVEDLVWSVEGLDAKQTEQAEKMLNAEKANMIKQANTEPDSTLTWKDNNTVVIKDSESEITFKRVK
ncbi:MAG: hypothetical protein HONBIEJF_00936 [Fimbriimonadaceae bacterium]|nr:hypothetical protein [Fimbriimonadaceae bacterium]